MTSRFLWIGLVAGAMLCASEASAQSSSPDSWQVQVVPYLWASGVDGQVGIGSRTADFAASFSNILSHLHMAAMGLTDVQHRKLVILTDAFYTDVRGQQATPGPLFSSVRPQQKLFMLTPEAGYRVLSTADTSLDVVGGMRLWHSSSQLQFAPGVLAGTTVQTDQTWADAIGGLRARRDLSQRWWVSGYGDFGAGGSDFTYQIVGTAGVDLHEHYALVFGYRYLKVDHDQDNFLLDFGMKGPLFGLTIKF
jgi:hypothetical protein